MTKEIGLVILLDADVLILPECESFVHKKSCCDVEENVFIVYVGSTSFKAPLNKKMWLLDYHSPLCVYLFLASA
jgi:hypothetical protein